MFWKNKRDGGGPVLLHMNRYKSPMELKGAKVKEIEMNKEFRKEFGSGQIILLSAPMNIMKPHSHSHLKIQNQIFLLNLLHDASRIKCSV